MRNKIEIISKALIDGLNDIISLTKKEIKEESFELCFLSKKVCFLFSCSLHHLDMPWQIICKAIKKNEIIGFNYEITPVFLRNIDENIELLVNKIKDDVKEMIGSVPFVT